MNNNKLNNFDQLLKSKIESHKVAFNESDWNNLQDKLPTSGVKPFYKNIWLWSGAAAIAILITSIVLIQNEQTKITSQKTVSSNSQNDQSVKEGSNIKSLEIKESNLAENTDKNVSSISNDKEIGLENNTIENSTNNTDNKETETTASQNHETEIVNTTDNVVKTESNLSPTVTPEVFNSTVDIPKPEAQILCKNHELCVGSTFKFETHNQENVDYLWSFGDGTFSKDQNPEHKYSEAGSYIVNLIVRSKIDNSILTKSKDILVRVIELPKVNFETEEKLENGIPVLSFINTTDKATVWSWNLGDGNISTDKDPSHNYRRKGYYNVSLTATNKQGCVNTTAKKVYVENDYNLLAPNSFTPNGDGINDFFIPEALKVMDVEFSMSIFGTANGLVFETKNINQQWDGINQQTGEKCNEGNYIWVVTLTNKEGKIEQYKGAVLLLK